MTAYQPIGRACREVGEIDALMRALRNLRHWTHAAASRSTNGGDQGRRLYATAARLRDEAWADSLHAAYRLFEIDAIHAVWAEGQRPRTSALPQRPALADILADIARADALALYHDRADSDRDAHAAAAQQADEAAEAGRRAARALIEATFPGTSWTMIAQAAL